MRTFLLTLTTWLCLACLATAHADAAVAPEGFDTSMVSILACPENLTPVRLATDAEIGTINARIAAGQLKDRAGATVRNPIDAALIREDSRIAYRFDGSVPVMVIEQGLVLDDSVGPPAPDSYR